jgi:hypothetical protein
MRTNVVLYVNNRKRKNIRELKGKIRFRDGYDYKS